MHAVGHTRAPRQSAFLCPCVCVCVCARVYGLTAVLSSLPPCRHTSSPHVNLSTLQSNTVLATRRREHGQRQGGSQLYLSGRVRYTEPPPPSRGVPCGVPLADADALHPACLLSDTCSDLSPPAATPARARSPPAPARCPPSTSRGTAAALQVFVVSRRIARRAWRSASRFSRQFVYVLSDLGMWQACDISPTCPACPAAARLAPPRAAIAAPLTPRPKPPPPSLPRRVRGAKKAESSVSRCFAESKTPRLRAPFL